MRERSSPHCCPRRPVVTTRGDGNLPLMGDSERRRELRRLFLELVDSDISGYCPIYERIVLALTEDPDTLDLITEHRMGTTRTPVLFLGATHDLILRDPTSPLAAIYRGEVDDDPWPLFRELVHTHRSAITECMRTRTTQTNEVGRSANLLAVYASISRELSDRGDQRPLAIIEIGPSAGLNLLADRYYVEYVLGDTIASRAGDPTSSVRLRCELRGDTPFPGVTGMRDIALREGLDPAPIDITNADDARWLRACVWPGIPDRPERLAAAIDIARRDPPHLRRGDAVQDLGALLEQVPTDVFPIITSTWVLAYLARPDRLRVCEIVDGFGSTRDLAFVTGEAPSSAPWVPALTPAQLEVRDDGTPTVFGVRTWFDGRCHTSARALCHPHGRWMSWLDTDSPAGEDRDG